MNNILEKIQRYWKFILGGIVVISLLLLIYVYDNHDENVSSKEENTVIFNETVTSSEERVTETVFVDIKGAVKKPGVYELPEGSRVIDAINKSGGLNKNADTSVINLSKRLVDGNVIIVYTKDKIAELQRQEVIIEYVEKECNCPDKDNSACIDKGDIVTGDIDDNKDTMQGNSKVSLNTATKEELMSISGIGESKAEDIIKYRQENGKFKNIEDIKNVKGIGDTLFEKIKEYITV